MRRRSIIPLLLLVCFCLWLMLRATWSSPALVSEALKAPRDVAVNAPPTPTTSPPAVSPKATPSAPVRAEFLGSEACFGCHPDSHEAWRGSVHARHMGPPSPETVLGDFTQNNVYPFKETLSRMFIEGDRYFIEHTNIRKERAVYEVHQVLGRARHQVYLHKQADGRFQVLPVYWNITDGRWRHSAEGAVKESALTPSDVYHWKNFGRNYNLVCMECHSSQPSRRFDLASNTYDSRFDPAINCESCHGPGSAHVARWRRLDQVEGPDETLAPVGRGDVNARIEICATCHAQKRVYLEGHRPGESFYDHFAPDVWTRKLTQIDGRSASLTYHFVDYMQSTCFRRSEQVMDCAGGCHPPHDLVSAREATVEEANAICTRCHVEHKTRLVKHTFHQPESEGSRCVACHMPKLDLDMDMFSTDHTIGSPLPELTRRFKIPNACNDCHKHDTPEWAEGHVQRWYGEAGHFQGYRARMVERAEVLDAAFNRREINAPILVAWLTDPSKDLITRASAAKLLGDSRAPEALKALLDHRADPHPLIRYYVIDSLTQSPMPAARAALLEALKDPRRVVRVRSYAALRLLTPAIQGAPEHAEVREEWRARQAQIRADDPRLKSDLAMSHFSRGELREAEAMLLHGIKVSGAVPGVRIDYVHFLMHTKRLDEAAAQVKILEEMHPGSVVARAARGVLMLGQGDFEGAARIFEALEREGIDEPTVHEGLKAARRGLQRTSRERHLPP